MNSNINETIDLGYSRRTDSHKYWCHLCKKEFYKAYEDNVEVHCLYCQKTFCEEVDITVNDQPSNFIPYENPRSNNNITNSNIRTNQESTSNVTGSTSKFILKH